MKYQGKHSVGTLNKVKRGSTIQSQGGSFQKYYFSVNI